MTTSWGHIATRPDQYHAVDDLAGAQFQTIDGVLHTDERTTELRFQLEWNAVTVGQFGTISTGTDQQQRHDHIPAVRRKPRTYRASYPWFAEFDAGRRRASKVNVSCSVRTVNLVVTRAGAAVNPGRVCNRLRNQSRQHRYRPRPRRILCAACSTCAAWVVGLAAPCRLTTTHQATTAGRITICTSSAPQIRGG